MEQHGNDIALTYAELEEMGIPAITIRQGTSRRNARVGKSWQKVTLDGTVHVLYGSIPARTRAKLPTQTELHAQLAAEQALLEEDVAIHRASLLRGALKWAHTHGRAQFVEHYLKAGYPQNKAIELAAAASVFAAILKVYRLPRTAELPYEFGSKTAYYDAVVDILPELGNRYINWTNTRYLKKKLTASDDTLDTRSAAVQVIDLPRKNNINRAKIGPWHKYIIELYLAEGANYKLREVHELLGLACEIQGEECPAFSTLKAYCARKDVIGRVAQSRYGEEVYRNTRQHYVLRHGPAAPNDVWELDGTRLNLPYKKDDGKVGFLDFIPVIDGHSLAILGYAVGNNENQWIVRQAIKMAVGFTGVVPCELVTDNSSATKAKETADLLQRMTGLSVQKYSAIDKANEALKKEYSIARQSKVGNARDKRIERFFQTFHNYEGNRYPNWLGEGVLSKRKNARATQEWIKAQRPNLPNKTGLLAQIAEAVVHYNHYMPHGKASPMMVYRASQSPNANPVPQEVQVMLFWERTLVTVSSNLVRIQVNKVKVEYRLENWEQVRDLNDGQVYAFYDLSDLSSIHIYAATGTREGGYQPGAYIGELQQAVRIHGTRASMTQADVAEMQRIERLNAKIDEERKTEIQRRRADAEAAVAGEFEEPTTQLHLSDVSKVDKNAAESSYLTHAFMQNNDTRQGVAEREKSDPVLVENDYRASAAPSVKPRKIVEYGDGQDGARVRRRRPIDDDF